VARCHLDSLGSHIRDRAPLLGRALTEGRTAIAIAVLFRRVREQLCGNLRFAGGCHEQRDAREHECRVDGLSRVFYMSMDDASHNAPEEFFKSGLANASAKVAYRPTTVVHRPSRSELV
jgi:hypothetical protein